jgi:putative tryptophan/tyrosine transport system substrate-binding protein
MRRREFIAGLGSSAAWPLAARAQQQAERPRRIGMLGGFDEGDPVWQAAVSTFINGLERFGWVNGRNVQIDVRGSAGGIDRLPRLMEELLDLRPDLIVTVTAPATRAAKQRTTSIPVLFIGLGDPIDSGLLTNIARPEANITGFAYFEPKLARKWLGLLKEAAPQIERVALILSAEAALRQPETQLAQAEAAASILGVRAIRTLVRNVVELQQAIEALAAGPYCGLAILPPPMAPDLRQSIIALAAKHRLPAIYSLKGFEEGLMYYGPDRLDSMLNGGPQYADRILRGENVSNLPVQFATKYELVLNRRTAKAIGLEFPATLLALADEVIE